MTRLLLAAALAAASALAGGGTASGACEPVLGELCPGALHVGAIPPPCKPNC